MPCRLKLLTEQWSRFTPGKCSAELDRIAELLIGAVAYPVHEISTNYSHPFYFFLCCLFDRYDNEAGYSKRMAELCNIVAAMSISGKEPSFKYE
jgi:hypothetical protein